MDRLKRGQQALQVLARLDGADEEQIAVWQVVPGAGCGHHLRWLRAETGGSRLVNHRDLLRRKAVGGDQIAPRPLGDCDDMAGTLAVEWQGPVQVPAVQGFVVRRQVAKYEVMNGEHSRDRPQWQQEMLSRVKELRAGQQAIESEAGQLPQPDQQAPGFVAQGDRAAGQMFQADRRSNAPLAIVEQHMPVRLDSDERAGQAFGVTAQPGALVDGSGDIDGDHVSPRYQSSVRRNPSTKSISGSKPSTRRAFS